jgi:pimeloyl-ACP methyl ester carboxylesterase
MQCELANATIHWEEHGEGRPIVFIHGWTMDLNVEASVYEPLFAQRTGFRRIYFDLPGMGRSRATEGIGCQDDVLAAVLAFIDRVLPDGRFLLAGASGGAYLARAVAARRRPRVAGLLLRVPAVVPDTAKRTLPPQRPLVRDDALMASLTEEERAIAANALVQSPSYLEAHGKRWREIVEPAIAAASALVIEIRNDPARYGFSFDLGAEEKGFAAPSLIIAGRQDTVVGYRDVWNLLENYPRATFAVVDRADHGWPFESVGLLAALVDDWLARIVLHEKGA